MSDYITVSDLAEGVRLRADGGFFCLAEGEVTTVSKAHGGGFAVRCGCREHAFAGLGSDPDAIIVGFTLADGSPARRRPPLADLITREECAAIAEEARFVVDFYELGPGAWDRHLRLCGDKVLEELKLLGLHRRKPTLLTARPGHGAGPPSRPASAKRQGRRR